MSQNEKIALGLGALGLGVLVVAALTNPGGGTLWDWGLFGEGKDRGGKGGDKTQRGQSPGARGRRTGQRKDPDQVDVDVVLDPTHRTDDSAHWNPDHE